jgi:hypothetical protein
MKCAINSNKRTSDTALHHIRQLLANVCVCGTATALTVSPRLVFDAREAHVVFVVDKLALRQVVNPSTWECPYQLSFHQCSTLIYPPSGRWTMGPLEEQLP